MSNVLKRIITFVIAIPGLALMVVYLPHMGYLWITIFLACVGFISGLELKKILCTTDNSISMWVLIFPTTAPILSWLITQGWLPDVFAILAIFAGLLFAFGSIIFSPANTVEQILKKLGIRLIAVFYPGFFLWWMKSISTLPHAPYALVLFLFMVTLNDSSAWLFGNLFGRHRNIVAVSPNKSVEGFTAGILVSTAIPPLASVIVPQLLPQPLWQLILFGFAAGLTTIMGDLVESALKRAADIKDSGTFMFGRGGMLDSIDSWLFTAPVIMLFLQSGT